MVSSYNKDFRNLIRNCIDCNCEIWQIRVCYEKKSHSNNRTESTPNVPDLLSSITKLQDVFDFKDSDDG